MEKICEVVEFCVEAKSIVHFFLFILVMWEIFRRSVHDNEDKEDDDGSVTKMAALFS